MDFMDKLQLRVSKEKITDPNMLTEIIVDPNNSQFESLDGVLYSKDGTTLICYPAGKTATQFTIPNSVTNVDNTAFDGLSSLTIYCEAQSKPAGWGSLWNQGGTQTLQNVPPMADAHTTTHLISFP